jgi:predicted GTPase
MLNLEKPEDVYTSAIAEIEKLLQSFTEDIDEDEIRKAQEEAKQSLETERQKIQDSLVKLERNAEWNVFTTAFYGETNAGKSTLIEALRILLKEPEKTKERQEFERLFNDAAVILDDIEKCKTSLANFINEYERKINGIDKQMKEIAVQIQKNSSKILPIQEKIKALYIAIKQDKKYSLGNFFRYLFKKLPSQNELKENKNLLKKIELEQSDLTHKENELLQSKKTLSDELTKQKNTIQSKMDGLSKQIEILTPQFEKCIDGKIIGDGRSDFTRTVTKYSFGANNQEFALLDLPGIEGNETEVLESINTAVQQAHAVFYVTGKPMPPQTSDGKEFGTLEKIKKHLGSQAEVYTLFNKRASNQNSLTEPLTDEDENKSLKNLDTKMRVHLGDQYGHTFTLSAYPAFLSVANCWQNDHEAKKGKFLAYFKSSEALLERTRLRDFIKWFTIDIVNNYLR